MGQKLSLENEQSVLKRRIDENLNKKHLIELLINKQFEKLKRVEISLEKMQESGSEGSSTVRYSLIEKQMESQL